MAIADFTKAIVIDPDYVSAYISRGIAYLDQNKLGLAIADFTKAIEIDPGNKLAYDHRGGTYQILGKFDLAIADHSKAIEIDPKYAFAYNNYAWLLATAPNSDKRMFCGLIVSQFIDQERRTMGYTTQTADDIRENLAEQLDPKFAERNDEAIAQALHAGEPVDAQRSLNRSAAAA